VSPTLKRLTNPAAANARAVMMFTTRAMFIALLRVA
jgi:hypothetical protein